MSPGAVYHRTEQSFSFEFGRLENLVLARALRYIFKTKIVDYQKCMRPYQWFQLLKKRFKIIFNENSSASWGSFFSYILSNLKFRKNLCITLHGFAHIRIWHYKSHLNGPL